MYRCLCLLGVLLLHSATTTMAASYQFGSNAKGLQGATSATLIDEGFSLTLSAGPAGATFDESSSGGLGIDSTGVTGASDAKSNKFNLMGGNPLLAGEGEFVTFSWDQPGVLSGIDLDGVKDDALEYYILTTEGGLRLNLFDSEANQTVPGAVDAAVAAGVVTGQVVYLLEYTGLDDGIDNLAIPFAADEVFTLTYAELGSAFHPLEPGNGARFQGLSVESLPEPSCAILVGLAIPWLGCFRRKELRGK